MNEMSGKFMTIKQGSHVLFSCYDEQVVMATDGKKYFMKIFSNWF